MNQIMTTPAPSPAMAPENTLTPPALASTMATATTSHLVFQLDAARYAVPAVCVREIQHLPELTPLAGMPAYVVGVLNLRGQVVPVIDLAARLAQAPHRPRIDDAVIVLQWQETMAALMVSGVHHVRDIEPSQVEAAPAWLSQAAAYAVAGVAKFDQQIVTLLDVARLLHFAANLASSVDAAAPGRALEEGGAPGAATLALPHADFTPHELAILRERARLLRQQVQVEESSGALPLAVVGLNGEMFGIALEMVREFADMQHLTPVPCSPPHIVGLMNLRGDLLTLVDIRPALHLASGSGRFTKIMVVQTGEGRVGIPVDEVHDVLHLRAEDTTVVPMAVQAQGDEFLAATVLHGGRTIGLLDLHKLLAHDGLVVEEVL